MKMIKIEYTGSAPFREVPGVGQVTKSQEFEILDYMAASLLKSGEFREVKPKRYQSPTVVHEKKKQADAEVPAGGEK